MLLENKNKKYTQCKLSEEELEELLERLKSNEISMKEAAAQAGVCEKQINNYLKNGISLKRGHGSVKPYPDETVYKIMKLLSKNCSQVVICRELDINKSSLSNHCKVLSFVSNKCFVEYICLGGYDILLELSMPNRGPILYIKFTINTSYLIGDIFSKEIVKSLDKSVEYDIKYGLGNTVRDIIMKKASKDYFKYIPINPTMRLNETQQIERFKEFYERIINEIDNEEIYSSLKNIIYPPRMGELRGRNSEYILPLILLIKLIDLFEWEKEKGYILFLSCSIILIFVVLIICDTQYF